jgi:BMFP domain-containing protein YqiC
MESLRKLRVDVDTLCMPIEACIRVIAKCREEIAALTTRVDALEVKLKKRLSKLQEIDSPNE